MRLRIVGRCRGTGFARLYIDQPEPPPTCAEDVADSARVGRVSRRKLVTLWVVVTLLWTAATCLRAYRVWMPALGWPAVLVSPFTWVNLVVPPLTFAIVLFAIARVTSADRGSGSGS
jgi:hypothetical protein